VKHLNQLHVLVLGLGASGLAMARWCARHGAVVTVADTREAPPQLPALREQCPDVRFVAGAFSAALVEGTAIRAVYCSPGLSPAERAPVVDAARAMGLPVGGELDLFTQALADLAQAPQDEAVDAEGDEPSSVPGQGDEAEDAPGEEPEAAPDADVALDAQAIVNAPDDDAEPTPVVPPAPPVRRGYEPAVLAITGTNGKTTVTALTGLLVERAGKRVAVAGNIGPTLLDTLAERIDAQDLPEVWVLELSSFQLDTAQGFEPTAAAVLNISQDHLDWHGDMASYVAAKARIFGQRGLLILNRDDPQVMQMLPPPVRVKLQRPQVRAHVLFGGGMPTRPGDYGIERVNGMAWLVRAHEADETIKRKRGAAQVEEDLYLQRLMPADALRIRGQHNALNALAALALASAAGCALAPMLYGLREYHGEPHRVQPVAIVDEVEYFDDSKGTNVGATVAALAGLGAERKVVVILGGDGKGQDFSPLAEPVSRFARAVVLIGRDAPLIEQALAGAGVPMHHAVDMGAAVREGAARAHRGDAVLLSPACASFDMFRNYPHRAEVFCAAVQDLAESPDGPGADLQDMGDEQ